MPTADVAPYVVSFDPRTGAEVWKTELNNSRAAGAFTWPGVVTAHGNGDLYAMHGTQLARIDAETGDIVATIDLPAAAGFDQFDAAYNGFTISRTGLIVAKAIGRPAGCTEQAFLDCATPQTPLPPSNVVTVDPETLTVVDALDLPGFAGGRLALGVYQGTEYIYVGDTTSLFRVAIDSTGALTLDPEWIAAGFVQEGHAPASASVVMGDWVVFQMNSSPGTAPMTVHAVSQADASVILSQDPFTPGPAGVSFVPSSLTADPDTNRIYSQDTARGQIACLEVVDGERLEVRWVVDQRTLHHLTLIGEPDERVVVATDAPDLLSALSTGASTYDEQIVWRDAGTGEELARSGVLPPMAAGSPLSPGFFGSWYYPAQEGTLYEVLVAGPEQADCPADSLR